MGSSEFRPPQLSEELAWLPGWLQQHGAEEFVENAKESQALPDPAFKDVLFAKEDIAGRNDANTLSREGGYNHCHLFLSGEDNSLVSCSSKVNVLKCNLQLSTDVDSVCCATQIPDSLDMAVALNEVHSCFVVETPHDTGKIPYSSDASLANERNPSSIPIPETEMDDSVLESPKFKINGVEHCQKNAEVNCGEDTDIHSAVELSIAASEALVLLDVVKEDSVSEALPTKAVLEVALQMKKARLDKLEDDFHRPDLEPDVTESLCDLDDSLMVDAYEDVGLSYSIPSEPCFHNSGFLEVNQIKENHLGKNDNQCSDTELKVQNVNICSNSEKDLHEANMGPEMELKVGLPSDHLSIERHKPDNTPSLLLNASKLDSGFPMLFQENLDVLKQLGVNQTPGSATVDIASQQQDFHSGNFGDEGKATYLVSDRFKSRWLGGWTDKDFDFVAPSKWNDARKTAACFIHETSFLSESADVAPDENSVVQKQDSELEFCTVPSVPFEGLHSKVTEGILSFQDGIQCSSLSSVDPLCSVVPCSFPAESDADNDCGNNNKNFVAATSAFEFGYKQHILNQEQVCDHKQGSVHTVPLITDQMFPVTVPTNCNEQIPANSSGLGQTYENKSTSLKSYSRILCHSFSPSNEGCLKYNHLTSVGCNWGLLLGERGCANLSDKGRSSELLPSGSMSAGKDEKTDNENMSCSAHLRSVAKVTDEKRSCIGEDVNGIEIPIEVSEENRSPVILNRQSRRCFLASKTIIEEAATGKHQEISSLETAVPSEQKSILYKIQTQCRDPSDRNVLVRKHVHFSEVEEHFPQKNHQQPQSSCENGSIAKAGKRRKHSKYFISVQALDKENSSLNLYTKVRKKLIFQGIEFLLTGLSVQKEKDMEGQIRNFGGVVVYDMPSPPSFRRKTNTRYSFLHLPILLCSRKLQTTKFLYACAINALILKVDWLTDCVAAGTILQPEKYMILPKRLNVTCTRVGKPVHCSSQKYIFEGVGIMLHGKHSFCTKLAMIIKHGGGYVFRSIHRLIQYINKQNISIGAIVAEDKGMAFRHLKHCAVELEIPMMPATWIVKSLHSGKLLPFSKDNKTSFVPITSILEDPNGRELSVEI